MNLYILDQIVTVILLSVVIGFTIEKITKKEYRNVPMRLLLAFSCILSFFYSKHNPEQSDFSDILLKISVIGIMFNRWCGMIRLKRFSTPQLEKNPIDAQKN